MCTDNMASDVIALNGTRECLIQITAFSLYLFLDVPGDPLSAYHTLPRFLPETACLNASFCICSCPFQTTLAGPSCSLLHPQAHRVSKAASALSQGCISGQLQRARGAELLAIQACYHTPRSSSSPQGKSIISLQQRQPLSWLRRLPRWRMERHQRRNLRLEPSSVVRVLTIGVFWP